MEAFEYPGLSSEQQGQFVRFAQLLQEANQRHNLTRITSTQEIYQRHFADSLTLLPYMDRTTASQTLIDIGSGPGFPGLALAIARPDWQVRSVDATGKKVCFQQSVIESLALTQAQAIQGRAEDLGRDPQWREQYGVVTARAVARLVVLAELCLPLLSLGGVFLAMKGPDLQDELAEARSAFAILGGHVEEEVPYCLTDHDRDSGGAEFTLVVVRKVGQTPEPYPRLFQIIQKRPL